MGIDDLVNKAKDALGSEHGERLSDQGIQGAGDGFDRLSGERFAEHTDTVQEHGDRLLGHDADAADRQTQDDAPRQ
ncbi:antitoxin [Agrococcus citreus]|uniref:MT0933-like antitoxin protein n=1 Tax=Agrococcus citreus TaxID=84643 RepID=A0ABN1YTF7_9MICO